MPPGRCWKLGSAATRRLPAMVQKWSGCRVSGQVRTTKAATLANTTATQVQARPRGGPGPAGTAGADSAAGEPEGGAWVALTGRGRGGGVVPAARPAPTHSPPTRPRTPPTPPTTQPTPRSPPPA